jgi:DNA-binding transcriptional LysR family regulator
MSTDHLHNLQTFVAIADAGSFAGGARKRGLSAPAATRAVAALETRLGVTLILRTTRSLRLTEAGEQFLDETRRILAALEAAEAAVRGQRSRPEGLLSITAPELFGERHIAPLVFEFLDLHAQVRARAFFSNRVVNLIDEGFDLAIRIARLPDSGLTAVPIGTMRAMLVAAPKYLRRHGVPKTPRELAAHQAISFTIEGRGNLGLRIKGQRSESLAHERLLLNTNAVKVAAAVAGHGITLALAYQVTDELRDGRLRTVLSRYEPKPIPVHLVYPEGRAATAKVREFVSFAVERLRALPFLER